MTEETRRKISEAYKGHHHTEETKKKISEANKKSCKGQRNHCVPHTEETKKKSQKQCILQQLKNINIADQERIMLLHTRVRIHA